MIRYHGEPYEGSDDQANDMMRAEQTQKKPARIRVPKKIIYQLDLQIEAQRLRVAKAVARLVELKDARSQMEPIETEKKSNERQAAQSSYRGPS